MWCTVSKTLLSVLKSVNVLYFHLVTPKVWTFWVSLYASVVICECWIRILETSKIQGCRYMRIVVICELLLYHGTSSTEIKNVSRILYVCSLEAHE